MKTSVFSRVRRTTVNLNVFITRDENFYGIHWKRVNFHFILLFTAPMRVSDVITDVTKQNMNVMASTFSA